MDFLEIHKTFFETEVGAFSEVTERENYDSQITVTKEEKKIILNYFGAENIHKGNKSSDPEKASKEFLLYPDYTPITLNLVFPKPEKTELRLYLSLEHGFKPKGGEIWFVFLDENKKIVIGSYPKRIWNRIGLNINKHSFQAGAMTVIQMGEELIGHPSTAINELVKNGYDADATNTKVYFNVSNENSFTFIYDNGNGMDYDTLFGDWLKPSVSSKRKSDGKSEKYKRNYLGSKGIGRLAAMAIGETITVISRKSSEVPFNWITINRRDFREDKLLSEVEFPGDKIDDFNYLFTDEFYVETRSSELNSMLTNILSKSDLGTFEKGTLIIVENLDKSVKKIFNDDFSQTEFNLDYNDSLLGSHFYKSLSSLITPLKINSSILDDLEKNAIVELSTFGIEVNFGIEFGCNLLESIDEKHIDWIEVKPIKIQDVYNYRAYGIVNTDGSVKGFLKYSRIEEESFEETFSLSFEETQSTEIKKDLFNQTNKHVVGKYYFDIRIYDIGERDNLDELASKLNIENGSKFKNQFKTVQGLRISKNGFGVKPYGEEVEDWIGLSKERVQNPGQNINTNQILGYIYFFSPENDSLEEKTNREGFIENTAYYQMKDTVAAIFKTVGRKRYNYRLLHGIGRVASSKHSRPDFESFIETIKSSPGVNIDIIDYSEKFMKEVNTSMDNLEESLSFAERLASLGSGIELVYHEMAQPISGLRTTNSSLNLKKNKIDPSVLEYFLSDLKTLNYATDVLVELRASLQPAIGRTRKKLFSPYNTFIKVANLFKSDLDEFKITIVADERLKDCKIDDLEYAFWISFLNIINNAIYWIKKSERPGEIRFHMEGENFVISNTGPFIQKDVIEQIFEYGVTTRTEKNATGLGLAFTRSILSRNNWDIRAQNRTEGPTFIISKLEIYE